VPKREPFQLDPGRDLWDRQIGEGPEAYEAFQVYLHQLDEGQPRRSQHKAAASLAKSRALVSRWSAEYQWQARTEAYDRDQAALKRAETNRRVVRAADRHGRHMEAMATALIQPVQAYLQRLAELRSAGDDPFKGMDIRELAREAHSAARLMPALVQAERLVLGLSTERTELTAIDAARAEAQRSVAGKSRTELDAYLTGVDDGRAAEQARLEEGETTVR